MRKIYIVIPLILSIYLSCDDKTNESSTPSELILGHWEITEALDDYKQCDSGSGPIEEYDSTSLSNTVSWDVIIDEDSIITIIDNGIFTTTNWSQYWIIEDTLITCSGCYNLNDTVDYTHPSVVKWKFEFYSDDILDLSSDINCIISGTVLSTRRWERKIH